jgi:hypothetical protein
MKNLMKLLMALIVAGLSVNVQSGGGARLQANSTNKNAVIAGRLVFPGGTAVPGIRVSALALSNTAVAPPTARQTKNQAKNSDDLLLVSLARTDQEGRYRLVDIPPGRYFIAAGTLDAPVYFPGVLTEAAAKPVTLSAGETFNTGDFQMAGPNRIVGGKVSRDGHNRGTDVVLENSFGTLSAPIGGDGTFLFQSVAPGRYNLRVTPNIGPLGIQITVTDSDMFRFDVPVPRSKVTGGLLTIRVSAETGHVQPKVQVRLTRKGSPPGAAPLKTTVSSGTTRIEVPLGEYFVEASLAEPLPSGYVIKSIDEDGKRGLRQPLEINPENLIRIMVGPPPSR